MNIYYHNNAYPTNSAMMMPMLQNMSSRNNPNVFYFAGTSLSLQTRLDSMKDSQISQLVDVNITVTGLQIKQMNCMCYFCTIFWGSIFLLPLFCICCDWWRRCVFPAFDIPIETYHSMSRLFRSPNLRNITLRVVDNTFDIQKADMLCKFVSESSLKGFTFVNSAGGYDYHDNEYSDFQQNMLPIKQNAGLIAEIQWLNSCSYGNQYEAYGGYGAYGGYRGGFY